MYRYSVDNALTYTSDDFVLFREAPFACWMERLTLENPDHGIPPDLDGIAPDNPIERQDDIAETLRAEGKDVSLIDWDADEASRRAATLDAMRRGVDFIVNGQLALGPLSGTSNLLMRTSGYSELGDFLYIPCDTQAKTTVDSAFRLCFLADLLHSLQGQLPPQLLIIRGGDDLLPLPTEDHIYHYRAVKHRFMDAMRNFRKHRMPDPAESTHFGRWSDCAHEVLKQRLLREDIQQQQEQAEQQAEQQAHQQAEQQAHQQADQQADQQAEPRESQEAQAPQAAEEAAVQEAVPETRQDDEAVPEVEQEAAVPEAEQEAMMPLQQAVGSGAQGGPSSYDFDSSRRAAWREPAPSPAPAAALPGRREIDHGGRSQTRPATAPKGPTLVEQARMLKPGTYTVGPGSHRFPAITAAPEPARPSLLKPLHNRRASDAVLQNLEFVGSSTQAPLIGVGTAPQPELTPVASSAPSPNLRDPRAGFAPRPETPAPKPAADEPDTALSAAVRSVIDMDSSYPVSPPPTLSTADSEFKFDLSADADARTAVLDALLEEHRKDSPPGKFSDSLITSHDFED